MNPLTKQNFDTLIQHQAPNSVSIYMPTFRAGQDTQQNPIRLKNLLQQAADQLTELGLNPPEIDNILSGAPDLINDSDFWRHPQDGLAVFLSDTTSYTYRLPIHFDELLVVNNYFHIAPLLPLMTHNEDFYVLALSQNQVSFYKANRFNIEEITPEDMPRSMAEALQYDEFEKQIQQHASAANVTGQAGIFHGNDPNDDAENKKRILRFFQQVDKSVRKRLGTDTMPLIMAGVDYLLPIYESANTYPYLRSKEVITGNVERIPVDELHQRAWELLEPDFGDMEEQIVTRFEQERNRDLVSNQLNDILRAAYDARVNTVLIAKGVHYWGKYDREFNMLEIHDEAQAGDEDLLNLVTRQTLLKGGSVYLLDEDKLPDRKEVAALFRY